MLALQHQPEELRELPHPEEDNERKECDRKRGRNATDYEVVVVDVNIDAHNDLAKAIHREVYIERELASKGLTLADVGIAICR